MHVIVTTIYKNYNSKYTYTVKNYLKIEKIAITVIDPAPYEFR